MEQLRENLVILSIKRQYRTNSQPVLINMAASAPVWVSFTAYQEATTKAVDFTLSQFGSSSAKVRKEVQLLFDGLNTQAVLLLSAIYSCENYESALEALQTAVYSIPSPMSPSVEDNTTYLFMCEIVKMFRQEVGKSAGVDVSDHQFNPPAWACDVAAAPLVEDAETKEEEDLAPTPLAYVYE